MLDRNDRPESSRAADASHASDIVELVVLTTDDAFFQTLREAVGNARRLWHVPTADKVSDLLFAGQVGILVMDVQALREPAGAFLTQIKRQFPDLVIVAAGQRDAESALAALISAGVVYRFIHKPMSSARAKLFAESAVKKYDEQRKRVSSTAGGTAAAGGRRKRRLLGFVSVFAILAALAAAFVTFRQRATAPETARQTPADVAPGALPLLTRAAVALADNRLAAPSGDNALELYLRALAVNPGDPVARSGLAEVRERLLARAEFALLEERYAEAQTAIETARNAGVESGRIAFLTLQLANSRGQTKSAHSIAAPTNATPTPPAVSPQSPPAPSDKQTQPAPAAMVTDDRVSRALNLAAIRTREHRLLEPERDNARFYVLDALAIDPANRAAQAAEEALALTLLTEAHEAIDKHDFLRAATVLEAAKGIAAASNVNNLLTLLSTTRQQVEQDTKTQLLATAEQRLQQDHLNEPANDSAEFYLSTLRKIDPANPGLASATQDLGNRLLAKAHRAFAQKQDVAAKNLLEEAAAVGFSSTDAAELRRAIDEAADRQALMANVIAASTLKLTKSTPPIYPRSAEIAKKEGWVELDFTVAATGATQDIEVHAANPAGIFESAAIAALSQWRYQPVLRDNVPTAQRARIRIRFVLDN